MIEVAAVQGRTNANLAAGYGFTGILVAFLARQNPLAIIPVAILLGGISASGGLLQRRLGLPDASVLVLQGIIFVFVLASDADGAVRARYGVVRNMFGMISGRVTFVIDRKGIIRHTFDSHVRLKGHIATALEVDLFDRDLMKSELIGRLVVPREFMEQPGLDDEVARAVKEALRVLEGQGAVLVDITLPHVSSSLPAYYVLAPAEASSRARNTWLARVFQPLRPGRS